MLSFVFAKVLFLVERFSLHIEGRSVLGLRCFSMVVIAFVFYLQYLDDYNMNSSKEMKLVFFMDAIEHVSRCADS